MKHCQNSASLNEIHDFRDSHVSFDVVYRKADMKLPEDDTHILEHLVGSRLLTYGSAKPGVDLGFSIEEVFLEFEDSLITVREEYVSANVCGEIGEYLALRVLLGYDQRREADIAGGVYYFFKGETLRNVTVHRARLIRNRDSQVSSFEHDALLEFEFELGSLWILKDELSTPFIQLFTSKDGQSPVLPNHADGWPNTLTDRWTGEWIK